MAVTIYGLTLLLITIIIAALWRYAIGARLIRPDVSIDAEEAGALRGRLIPGLGGYVAFPGVSIAAEAPRLHRGRVRLERDLGVRRQAPT